MIKNARRFAAFASAAIVVAVASAVAMPASAAGASRPWRVTWVPIWGDSFSGPRGALPSSSRWLFDTGCNLTGAMDECDTKSPLNIALDGHGHLLITARSDGHGHYTSARVRSRLAFVPAPHGILEISARLRAAPTVAGAGRAGGMDSAFWMWPEGFPGAGQWPQVGELDVMENFPSQPQFASETLWCGSVAACGEFPVPKVHLRANVDGKPLWDAYHTYTLIWQRDPDIITWTVDGRPFLRATPKDTTKADWAFDKPFYPLFSVLAGKYLGTPAAKAFPATMSIAWITISRGVRHD
jgi:beta-glucanase (GH16 family)